MELEILTKFGLTNVEAQIYLEIFKLKESQIGMIIKKTGLHRGTVYNSINNLIEKGFVSFVNKSGVRHYKTCDISAFGNFVENKQRELIENKKKVEGFLSELGKINEDVGEQDVSVFHGVEAFKTAFFQIYDYCKKNDCEYLFQGRGGEMYDSVGEAFYTYTQKLKDKMKIQCRVILSKETKSHFFHRYASGDIKHLSVKLSSPVSFWIYGDNVLIVLFKENPLTTIRIRSKSLADGFRNYFDYLWKIADK